MTEIQASFLKRAQNIQNQILELDRIAEEDGVFQAAGGRQITSRKPSMAISQNAGIP